MLLVVTATNACASCYCSYFDLFYWLNLCLDNQHCACAWSVVSVSISADMK